MAKNKKDDCFLLTRQDLFYLYHIDPPARGEVLVGIMFHRNVILEHTDLHRKHGARLFRMTWLDEVES